MMAIISEFIATDLKDTMCKPQGTLQARSCNPEGGPDNDVQCPKESKGSGSSQNQVIKSP